jgi:hypothetical protein
VPVDVLFAHLCTVRKTHRPAYKNCRSARPATWKIIGIRDRYVVRSCPTGRFLLVYLFDNTVVFELRKIRHKKADVRVGAWADKVYAAESYLSVITVQEL